MHLALSLDILVVRSHSKYFLANLGLFSLIRFVTSYLKKSCLQQCGGVVVAHVLWEMVWFGGKLFISHPVECMNSYNIWICIYDEFSKNSYIFCTLNIWIHTNMNSYYVWIHIFFAVIMYECIYFLQCKIKAASAQRKPRGQSPSSPPAPTRPRPAAPTVRVACDSPNS